MAHEVTPSWWPIVIKQEEEEVEVEVTPKKNILEVCRVCSDPFASGKHKRRIFPGKCSSDRPDYTKALDDIIGKPCQRDDGLSQYVCSSCLSLLVKYDRSKREMEMVRCFVSERAQTTRPRTWRCAPTTPTTSTTSTTPTQPQKGVASETRVASRSSTPRSFYRDGDEDDLDTKPVDARIRPLTPTPSESGINTQDESRPHPTSSKSITRVIVTTGSTTSSAILTGQFEKIAKSLMKKRTKSLPKLIMNIPEVEDLAIKEVTKRVDRECTGLTGTKFTSVLKKTSPSDLRKFSWDKVLDEWKQKAPTFLQFLISASNVVHKQATGQSGKQRKICTMSMAGAALLRARSKFMTAPMYKNAFVMHHGGAKKQCYDRLSRIGVSVSRKSCLRKLKTISQSWEKYLQWKKNVSRASLASSLHKQPPQAVTLMDHS